jgi:hypothetical protein
MVIGVWKGWEFMFLVERYPGLDFVLTVWKE